jgi:hypothetical protein
MKYLPLLLLLSGCGTFTGYDLNANTGTQLGQMPYGTVSRPVYNGGVTLHYEVKK